AYDSHCNLVLGDVEETIYVVEEDENEEETLRVWDHVNLGSLHGTRANLGSRIQTIKKQEEMLFVRGESKKLWKTFWGYLERVADSCLGDSVVLISPQA
ncbi:unnamed protein product, partial [Penicillium palitans]